MGKMTLKDNTTDANMIDFFEGSKLAFQANKLTLASNGTTFSFPQQNIEVDGSKFIAVGYNGVQLGSSLFNGYYGTADRKVKAYIEMKGYNLVIIFEGTKI